MKYYRIVKETLGQDHVDYYVICNHGEYIFSPNKDEATEFYHLEVASRMMVELSRNMKNNRFVIEEI